MSLKLLAIETAGEACSAAVWVEGGVIEQYQLAPRRHNELILSMCEQALAQAQLSLRALDAIAFGCGPGAFTGVRIAASVAQGIALAHDLPVAPVSTLANLAFQAEVRPEQLILPAIDARMNEIYWAIYKKNSALQLEQVAAEKVQSPHTVITQPAAIACGLGSGWQTYEKVLAVATHASTINKTALPRAAATAQLAQQKYCRQELVEAHQALPVYLRNQVVDKKS